MAIARANRLFHFDIHRVAIWQHQRVKGRRLLLCAAEAIAVAQLLYSACTTVGPGSGTSKGGPQMSVKSDVPLDQQAPQLADSDDRHWAANETPARGKRLPKGIQKAYKHSQYEVHHWLKCFLSPRYRLLDVDLIIIVPLCDRLAHYASLPGFNEVLTKWVADRQGWPVLL